MRLSLDYNQKENPAQKSYVAEFLDKLRERYWFRVLVVEDSIDSRNLLRLAMDTLPCNIDFAEDGFKARRMLERNKNYDLVIVDQELPDTTGLKVLEAIDYKKGLKNEPTRPIPFIVYSGLDLKPLAQMTQFEFADFIKKPTNLSSIHDRIEHVLKNHRAEQR